MPRLRRRALRGASPGRKRSKTNPPSWWGFSRLIGAFGDILLLLRCVFQSGRISESGLAGSATCETSREAITSFTPPVPFYENESNPDLRRQGREFRGQMKGAGGGKGTKTK